MKNKEYHAIICRPINFFGSSVYGLTGKYKFIGLFCGRFYPDGFSNKYLIVYRDNIHIPEIDNYYDNTLNPKYLNNIKC